MNRSIQFVLCFAFLVGLSLSGCGGDDDPVWPAATTTGTISVNTEPSSIDPPWQLSGPDSYLTAGTGDLVLNDLTFGTYTMTWGTAAGWVKPNPGIVSQTLADGDTVTFSGTYTVGTGTIVINQSPDNLTGAGWSLSGPQTETGSGDLTLTDMSGGQYILTWDSVDWYLTPPNDTQTLHDAGTLTFSGTYSEDPEPVDGFVLIPPVSVPMPATFTMGSTVVSDETPHQVTLTGRFSMASTEVTNAQYVVALQWAYDQGYVTATSSSVGDNLDGSTQELLDLDSSYCQISFSGGVFSSSNPDRPVVAVPWYGSVAYCDWLSLQDGLPRAYDHGTWSCNSGNPYDATGYRLPTEAEWEFACRAGTTTHFNTGDCLDAETEANYRGEFPSTGCPTGPYLEHTADVGSYPANQWGLFDMHGNVWEWCNDWYGAYNGNETDPEGVGSGSYRAVRGGSWDNYAVYCRSADRNHDYPNRTRVSFGFRPVRSTQ